MPVQQLGVRPPVSINLTRRAKEDDMKSTYAAPAIVTVGDAVKETKSPFGPVEAPHGPGSAPGSVGFNL